MPTPPVMPPPIPGQTTLQSSVDGTSSTTGYVCISKDSLCSSLKARALSVWFCIQQAPASTKCLVKLSNERMSSKRLQNPTETTLASVSSDAVSSELLSDPLCCSVLGSSPLSSLSAPRAPPFASYTGAPRRAFLAPPAASLPVTVLFSSTLHPRPWPRPLPCWL